MLALRTFHRHAKLLEQEGQRVGYLVGQAGRGFAVPMPSARSDAKENRRACVRRILETGHELSAVHRIDSRIVLGDLDQRRGIGRSGPYIVKRRVSLQVIELFFVRTGAIFRSKYRPRAKALKTKHVG